MLIAAAPEMARMLMDGGFQDVDGGWHTEDCRLSELCTERCNRVGAVLRKAGVISDKEQP